MIKVNMTRRIRRIILFLAILFFILISPLILFYAWGYTFDWNEKKPVLTGGFYLRSIPKNAEIYLDDELIEETPNFIKRLAPKEYQVKVVKEGYHPWQKKLRVESKLVTEAKNILLIPTNPKIEIVDEKLPSDFSLNDFLTQKENNLVFYIQKPSYILYKTDKEGSFKEQINSTPLPNNRDYKIVSSTNESIALLSDKKELFLFNPEIRAFDLISQNVQGFEFSKNNEKLLYFTPNEIWVYYLESISSIPNRKVNNKELITRSSQKIKKAAWYHRTSEHIVFSVGQEIKIIELDGRDQRNTVDLIKMDVKEIGSHQTKEIIYLIQEDKLIKISLK
jgi:hypothetical protein